MAEIVSNVSDILHSSVFENFHEDAESIPPVARSRIERTISGFTPEERVYCLSVFRSDELLGEIRARLANAESKQQLIEEILSKK